MRVTPASRYTDPAFLRQEQERVFARAWIAVAPMRTLPNRGDYAVVDHTGRSIMLVNDGHQIRAFLNTCRHRGTQLLVGRGNTPAIRCPYHDWKYALDGRLRHIPGQDGFEPLTKEALGLAPVRCDTYLGFVWVTESPAAPSLHASLGALVDELKPYRLDEMVPIQEKTWTLNCNWKAVLDNATESYHIPAVHGASIGRYVTTNPDFRAYGDHYRLTLGIGDFAWRRWLDQATSRRGPYTPKQRAELHKYVIFPNLLLNVLPYHLTVFQVTPLGPNACRFFYGFYKRRGARGLEWLRAYGTWAASRLIWREDEAILNRFQHGARAGRHLNHHFHQGEVAIAHFHRVLGEWLARP